MDHDAMLTHVNKLKTFRDDFLVLSDMTMEEFHAKADEKRAENAKEAAEKAAALVPPTEGTEVAPVTEIAPTGSAAPAIAVPVPAA
jgi:hypothetical protein